MPWTCDEPKLSIDPQPRSYENKLSGYTLSFAATVNETTIMKFTVLCENKLLTYRGELVVQTGNHYYLLILRISKDENEPVGIHTEDYTYDPSTISTAPYTLFYFSMLFMYVFGIFCCQMYYSHSDKETT